MRERQKTCKNCDFWHLYINERDKRQTISICMRFPPSVVLKTLVEPSQIVGQPSKMVQVPTPINPPTSPDHWCGEWVKREGELKVTEISSSQQKPDLVVAGK